MSQQPNPGWIFYHTYYEGFRWELLLDAGARKEAEEKWKKKPETSPFFSKNTRIYETSLPSDGEGSKLWGPIKTRSVKPVELKTCYPGMLLGSGYPHGAGVMGEFKIGFFFDHTTGLPVIPGSSIKGVLRSVFPGRYEENNKNSDTETRKELAAGRRAYLIDLLSNRLKVSEEVDKDFVQRLELEIFEGVTTVGRIPMCQRDIFHDAMVFKAPEGIFGDDYITPHKDPLKNPIPIQFLKVLPEVTFHFHFELKDQYSVYDEQSGNYQTHDRLLKAGQRRELFRLILLDVGVGAKTNVGYGHWIDPDQADTGSNDKPSGKDVQVESGNEPARKPKIESRGKPLDKWKQGEHGIIGVVKSVEGSIVLFEAENISDWEGELEVSDIRKTLLDKFRPGKKFNLKLLKRKPNKKKRLPAQVHSYRPL